MCYSERISDVKTYVDDKISPKFVHQALQYIAKTPCRDLCPDKAFFV